MSPIIVRGNIPPEDPELDPTNPGRLVFSAWGDDSRWRPSPGSCPLCGATDMTCTSHGTTEALMSQTPSQTPIRETRLQGAAEDYPDANLYVCPDDVVEEYLPYGGTSRVSHRLVHRKGETISRERAVQLGLLEGPPAPIAQAVTPSPRVTVVEGQPVTPTQH